MDWISWIWESSFSLTSLNFKTNSFTSFVHSDSSCLFFYFTLIVWPLLTLTTGDLPQSTVLPESKILRLANRTRPLTHVGAVIRQEQLPPPRTDHQLDKHAGFCFQTNRSHIHLIDPMGIRLVVVPSDRAFDMQIHLGCNNFPTSANRATSSPEFQNRKYTRNFLPQSLYGRTPLIAALYGGKLSKPNRESSIDSKPGRNQ